MYGTLTCASQIEASASPPPPHPLGIPQAFGAFSFQEWVGEILPRSRAFDHHSYEVGINLIANLDFTGHIMAKTNFDEFKGNGCKFIADWLKTKVLHKL